MHENEQALVDEIVEISKLIESWNGSEDPQTQWAISLLQRLLLKRMVQLSPPIH